LILAIAAPAAAGARPTKTPTLRLLERQPVTVRGRSFRGGERVKVRLHVSTTETNRSRSVTAARTGTFTVAFTRVGVGKCTAFSVVAIGSEGSSARLKVLPLPGCIPA
jgi:hypothetical protein